MLSEEQARREAMAEGRRLLQELEAAQQAKMREKQEADDARHERLLGYPRPPSALLLSGYLHAQLRQGLVVFGRC